jgi:glycerol-3-phosphate acyltransferase PlsX
MSEAKSASGTAPVSAILAVDAMGGDHAPDAIIAGLDRAAERHPHAQFLIFGDAARVEPLIRRAKRLQNRATLRPTTEIIADDLKPTAALGD